MPSAVRSPRVLRKLRIAWIGLAVSLTFGFLSASLSSDLRAAEPGEGSAAEVAGPANLDLADDSPADAFYAGIDLNLIEARPIPVNTSDRPIIVVNFEATNNTAFQRRLPMNQFRLVQVVEPITPDLNSEVASNAAKAKDPMIVGVDRFEFSEYSDRLVLEPGRTVEATAVFKLLPGASTGLEEWSLQMAEANRWPAAIPLSGSVEPSQTVQPLVFADPAQSNSATTYLGSEISVLDTESSLNFRSYRAPIGDHLALFVIEIAANDGNSTAQFRDLVASANQSAFWNLTTGEDTVEALKVEVRTQSSSSTTYVVVFNYPVDGTDLTLYANFGQLEMAELAIETL